MISLSSIIGFVVLLLILGFPYFWKKYNLKTSPVGAPYEPMTPEVVARVIEMLKIGSKDIFYDLGSGDGRLVTAAAAAGAMAYGVEIDKFRVWYSRLWISLMRLSSRAKIIEKDIFSIDYSNATAINLYLLPETNLKLSEKLKRELKPGTRLSTVAFTMPETWQLIDFDPRGTIYGPVYIYQA